LSRLRVYLLVLCGLSLFAGSPGAARAVTLPSGFDDQLLAAVGFPTGISSTPDGRLLIAQQTGRLLVYKNGALNPTPAIDLSASVCTDIERGLEGVTVGPDFADTHFVYLYYTYKGSTTCGTDPSIPSNWPGNRVSRFVLGNNDVLDPSSETVVIDNIKNVTGNHNAGDLHFGKDGYLYVSSGDGGCDPTQTSGCYQQNAAARYPNVMNGKILRIGSDGSVPPDNPHVGSGTARCNVTGQTAPGTWCQEVYAFGLRNPFRFAFDPNAAGTIFYINDVGLDTWEEIDLGQPGADYGWNVREGHCAIASTGDCGTPPTGMTNPIYDYAHSSGCTSVTSAAFVPDGLWPAQYDGSYLFGDFVCGKLFQLLPNGSGGYTSAEFGSGLGGPVGMTFAPYGTTQALYYMTWASPPGLHRIAYTGSGNRSPTASATATPTSGNLPLNVDFDGTASSDPDNDTLTYDWDFGDGSAHSSNPTPSHTYTTAGTRMATLTVDDGHGGQNQATIRIDAGNNPPGPVIDTPTESTLFSVGQDITLSGHATDPDEGALPSSALSWRVIKHHATHYHPFLPPTSGNDLHISAPQPEDLSSATNSYLEVFLTATDSNGLTTTVSRNVYPKLVNLTLATNPSGLSLELNGLTSPSTFTSWAGWQLSLSAPEPQTDSAGQGETFLKWSDGGARTHTITTPQSPATYTATFTRSYVRPKGASPLKVPLVPAYRPCTSPNRTHGPPLAFGSCSPPVQASDYVTVGTADSNGYPTTSTGLARFTSLIGDPTTPTDEADVAVRVMVTDVRDRTQNNAAYVGELQASSVLRISDRINGTGGSGVDPATVVDTPLNFSVPCIAMVDTGSKCSTSTSADAVMPGMVVEGKRTIWQIDRVNLYDGGPDGVAATADNTLFETQGLFVP
jgi:glucose/arabinose dehydrogenase/PKD repeat protein